MKKTVLVLAMTACLWAASPASADSSQPAPEQQAQASNATKKDAGCAQSEKVPPAAQGSPDAPQNQIEYGGGA